MCVFVYTYIHSRIFMYRFHRRRDLSEELAKIADLDMLMFVGDNTMLYVCVWFLV